MISKRQQQLCEHSQSVARKIPKLFHETINAEGNDTVTRLIKALSTVGLGILLLIQPVWVAAGAPRDQVRQTVDKLISILNDPQLKGEYKKNERRQKLKEVLYQRFDFTEMARRSLGVE
jgi:MlaC protein